MGSGDLNASPQARTAGARPATNRLSATATPANTIAVPMKRLHVTGSPRTMAPRMTATIGSGYVTVEAVVAPSSWMRP